MAGSSPLANDSRKAISASEFHSSASELFAKVTDSHLQVTRTKNNVQVNLGAQDAGPGFRAEILLSFLHINHLLKKDDFVRQLLGFAFEPGLGHDLVVLILKSFAGLFRSRKSQPVPLSTFQLETCLTGWNSIR